MQDPKEEVVENVKIKLSESSRDKDFVLKAEMLEKKAVRTPRKWIPRYFALCQRVIKWYLSEEHMNKDPSAAIGVIQLEHIYKIRVSKQEDPQKLYGIVIEAGSWQKKNQIYQGRSLFLACKDVNQAEDWYIWIQATRTKVILEEFWGNFEDKTKVFNQLSSKPLSYSNRNPFEQTTSGLYHPRNFKNPAPSDNFESTASSYRGRETLSSNGTGYNSSDAKIGGVFHVEVDPADLERNRTPTAEFGSQAQISSSPDKTALLQGSQDLNTDRLRAFEAIERSKQYLNSQNVSPASQRNEAQTTTNLRNLKASPEIEKNLMKESPVNYSSQRRIQNTEPERNILKDSSAGYPIQRWPQTTETEKDIPKDSSANYWSQRRAQDAESERNTLKDSSAGLSSQRRQQTRVKSNQRLLLEDFLNKTQATFWCHILTAPSKPQLKRIYHLNGVDESPRARDDSPKDEFIKIQENSKGDANVPVSILRKRSSSRDRADGLTRKRSTSRDSKNSNGRKRSVSRDVEEQVETVHKVPNRVYQNNWEGPQSRRSGVFNDDGLTTLVGTAQNSRFFDKSEGDDSAYQDLQNMSFAEQSNMSFTKEFGEAPEEREVIKKSKNSSRIYTENITIYTQKPQKGSRRVEEDSKGPSRPNIYGKYEMFTSFFVDSHFDRSLVPSENNCVSKVQPKKNRLRKQKYPNIMRARRINGEPHTFEVSETLMDRNRPVVYTNIGAKKLTNEEFSYQLPVRESPVHKLSPYENQNERRIETNGDRGRDSPLHTLSHYEQQIERRGELNVERGQRPKVPEYRESPSDRYLNSEYRQPLFNETKVNRTYADSRSAGSHGLMEQASLPGDFISKALDHTSPSRYVELKHPYDTMAQSMVRDEDDEEGNIEPIEDEESLPQITHETENGQLIDFNDKGNTKAYSFGIVKNNTVAQDGDTFRLKKGDYVIITRVYERRRLVECLWQGMMGLFSLDDFTLVANSKAVQDEQQNILIFNDTSKTKSPVEESPTKAIKRNKIFESSPPNVQFNVRSNEDHLYTSPTRKYIDEQAQPRTIYLESTKSPVTMLKRELRDNSFSGSDNSKAETKASSNNTTPKEVRFYNNY